MHGARNPALEAYCIAAPDDAEALAVWSDWLQENDDPLGGLIALETIARRTRTRETVIAAEQYLAKHHDLFLGPLAPQLQHGLMVTWKHGVLFEAGLHVHPPGVEKPLSLAERIRLVLALPAARLLRSLRIEPFRDDDTPLVQEALTLVASEVRSSLRELHVGHAAVAHPATPQGIIAELPGLPEALPNLQTLQLCGDEGGLEGMRFPMVEHLSVRLLRFVPSRLSSDARLPSLQTLTLDTPEFAAPRSARLRRIHLHGAVTTTSVAQMLASDAAARVSESITVNWASLRDDSGQLFVDAAPRLIAETIDLRANSFSPAMMERLRAAYGSRVAL